MKLEYRAGICDSFGCFYRVQLAACAWGDELMASQGSTEKVDQESEESGKGGGGASSLLTAGLEEAAEVGL